MQWRLYRLPHEIWHICLFRHYLFTRALCVCHTGWHNQYFFYHAVTVSWSLYRCLVVCSCFLIVWRVLYRLTHWGRVTHICVGKLSIIGSDNGLSPGRRLAIIWTNAGILLIGPLGANFNEIIIAIPTFSFKKMRFKMSSAKWRPFCLGLIGLRGCDICRHNGKIGVPYIHDTGAWL